MWATSVFGWISWKHVLLSRQKETPNTSWPANNYRRAQADVFDWAHDQGGVIRGKSGGLKPDRSRRSWSPREEEVLILALKDLVTNRWKADNGFRAGFLTRVEEFVRREIPTTTVRAQPHISSKINTWKKFYNSLNMMLDCSGVGFNSDGEMYET
ncbi:hypothetical protein SASPL_140896 [Salvia splendens]|uniref:Myb/SANT-like domain-containing protein n=1 Tax=Salvia splendens TaxID=180675 RepID=A0A8X8WR63_SALSN|nr:hypothetical protein SASPL_140896 [Salvia splendens]